MTFSLPGTILCQMQKKNSLFLKIKLFSFFLFLNNHTGSRPIVVFFFLIMLPVLIQNFLLTAK